MARMIPPYVPPECTSPGERALFERFREEAGTSEWTVLHSLGVARHPSRLAGEVDFLVVVPGEGVLCVEVKAGGVRREGGMWVYGGGGSVHASGTGPFRQAADGMHAIRRYLAGVDPSLNRVLFTSAVVFTSVTFDETSPEWFPWQVVDRATLDGRSITDCCKAVLQAAHRHTSSTPSARWYDSRHSRPDRAQVARIVRALRGDFECPLSTRMRLNEAEREIRSFTEDQFSVLDALEENQQVLVKGPAGTGKTLLALEAARRSVLSGRPTLLCCFNRLLGRWLEREATLPCMPASGLLTVGTFHGILLRLLQLSVPTEARPDFWSATLPETALEYSLDGRIPVPLFRTAVVDEIQDLLTPEYLDVFDVLLDGGLGTGRWAMFGDLERQSVYGRDGAGQQGALQALLRDRSPHHFVLPLRINCRNTAQVTTGVELACALEPGYARILCTDAGPDIEVVFYRKADGQARLLHQKVLALRRDFRPDEIVVLSTREDAACCAAQVGRDHSDAGLAPFRTADRSSSAVGFATIHAFKGLEAPVVVLTDVQTLEGPGVEALLYVGMSRAKYQLLT